MFILTESCDRKCHFQQQVGIKLSRVGVVTSKLKAASTFLPKKKKKKLGHYITWCTAHRFHHPISLPAPTDTYSITFHLQLFATASARLKVKSESRFPTALPSKRRRNKERFVGKYAVNLSPGTQVPHWAINTFVGAVNHFVRAGGVCFFPPHAAK